MKWKFRQKYDSRCELEVSIKGPIRGKVIADLSSGGSGQSGFAAYKNAAASAKLWSNLAPEKAVLDIGTSAGSLSLNGMKQNGFDPGQGSSPQFPDGPQERTAA